jgi:hypothetical protein
MRQFQAEQARLNNVELQKRAGYTYDASANNFKSLAEIAHGSAYVADKATALTLLRPQVTANLNIFPYNAYLDEECPCKRDSHSPSSRKLFALFVHHVVREAETAEQVGGLHLGRVRAQLVEPLVNLKKGKEGSSQVLYIYTKSGRSGLQ